MILIKVDGQKFCGQMSLAVKCPAVKCHLGSNVLRSNVTCGQTSRSQMSLVVKCHLRSNVTVVKCNKILKWSKVPWSNETVVIGDPLTKSNRLSIFLSVLFSEHQKVGIGEARAHPTPLYLKIPYSCCIQFWNFLAKGHSK